MSLSQNLSFATNQILNQEICRTCGKCCLALHTWSPVCDEPDDFQKRILLLKSSWGYKARWIGDHIHETISRKCSALLFKDGKYSCDLYGNPERPAMCSEYPLNVILKCEDEKIVEYERNFCPLLDNLLKKAQQGAIR